ncbi:hypothetical protein KY290_027263 [Solanum tuberosum]|uniref:Uncharacterized protein n=1 Tax=Solanum tuberosum TaxID=4113 RepID=A0ABQ7UEF8_SOLTU|nr:hypothetical protein KY289_026448 [Solanum tuberosum]KAH0748031.1 hypothetical protein KY290_027263 [Solanum tuberosum]
MQYQHDSQLVIDPFSNYQSQLHSFSSHQSYHFFSIWFPRFKTLAYSAKDSIFSAVLAAMFAAATY